MEWIIHAVLGKTLSVVLNIPHDWLICSIVLLSMLLQVLLIFVGGIRYRFAKSILSFVSWISYLSADYVAIYALGLMLHSSRHEVGILYAVWAPLLLVHLGGPDTITAYSMTDNELWKRHALVMFYHLCVAAYLICVSLLPLPLEGQAERSILVAAIFIYFAGATKYFERTMALRFSSIPQLVSSTLPIDTFMQIEHEIEKGKDELECNYIVSGERKFFHEYRKKSEENLSEEGESFDKREKNFSKDDLKKMGVVTVGDVWEWERKQEREDMKKMGVVTDAGMREWERKQEREDYMLCLSHALFKSYMRRFGGLPFPEGSRSKTKEFFYTHLGAEKVFKVVERELKFTYDYLFSKSSRTAFSKLGTAMRFFNTGLLAVAWVEVFNTLALLEKQHGHNKRSQRVVTYILLYVAVVLEMFQLCRIVLSDWTRVWLVCAHIRHSHPDRSGFADPFKAMLIRIALIVAKCVQKFFSLGLKQNYWQNQIQQYSLTETCLTSSGGIEKVRCLTCTSTSKDNSTGCAGKVRFPTCASTRKRKGRNRHPAFLRWYIKAVAAWHMKPKPIDEKLRDFILEKIEEYCYLRQDSSTLPSRLLFSIREEIYKSVDLKLNTETWEREILQWHVATAICHGLDPDAGSNHADSSVCCGQGFVKGVWNFLICKRNSGDAASDDDPVKKNMRVSETLSNYCGYLLVSYASMLPLHPDMAKLEHEKLLLEIVPLVRDIKKLVRDIKKKKAESIEFWNRMKDKYGSGVMLSDAAALAVKLREEGKEPKDGRKTMLNAAAELAEKLMERDREARWKLISQLWSAFVLYYAYFYKATFHGGSLAAGGEYISQLWALLAHLGHGEQSDTAVGHRGGSDKPATGEANKGTQPAPAQESGRQTVEREASGEIEAEKQEDPEIKK